ncbi:adenine deaminase [Cyclobacterium jeungdonense]|uniref:Adenine deaminase n=1 Tax=Cyclobacterium jeungdonense TaxID=708087 RepID=A0ABT8C4W4_9BACT|nr:adenine deaminase [Cyclobacterium jeungdonense]MDN3687833.1 adenine deaminase [Cyclobacterium jeungdonense]
MTTAFSVRGQYVDIEKREIYPAKIEVSNGHVKSVDRLPAAPPHYLLPGFIDAHVHVESSLLVPASFARLAVVHGTIATVSDPHEIANVCGMEGIAFMIANGEKTAFKFFFGAPSCVPATTFETAGDAISPEQIELLFKEGTIHYLAEMMNWPSVLAEDPLVMKKIQLAHKYGKPVDGHAPGLTGEKAAKYAAAGITTDHECITFEEGRDRIKNGMKVAIREGSAARNFEALIDLIDEFPEQVMFCSDDKHPDSLLEGHINQLVARAVSKGKDLFDVLRAACITPVRHYGLPVGLLKEGDPADFILLKDLIDFKVVETYIDGQLMAKEGQTRIPHQDCQPVNRFKADHLDEAAFELKHEGGPANVIQALDRQLITRKIRVMVPESSGKVISDTQEDILKIAVINRYEKNCPPQVALIKGFGLKEGAIASSVAHDSHNLIVVGVTDEDMRKAANMIIGRKGGLAAVDSRTEEVLPLEVAGLMSKADAFEVSRHYTRLDKMAKAMGSNLQSPFMTLSFMALLVIPSIKLSDKGLFDGEKFEFTQIFSNRQQGKH